MWEPLSFFIRICALSSIKKFRYLYPDTFKPRFGLKDQAKGT